MECESNQREASVELKVNGAEIALNDFVKGFISKTVTGMVESLRGVGDIDTIELKVSKSL